MIFERNNDSHAPATNPAMPSIRQSGEGNRDMTQLLGHFITTITTLSCTIVPTHRRHSAPGMCRFIEASRGWVGSKKRTTASVAGPFARVNNTIAFFYQNSTATGIITGSPARTRFLPMEFSRSFECSTEIRRRCVGTLIRSGDCGPWVTWAWSAADTLTNSHLSCRAAGDPASNPAQHGRLSPVKTGESHPFPDLPPAERGLT